MAEINPVLHGDINDIFPEQLLCRSLPPPEGRTTFRYAYTGGQTRPNYSINRVGDDNSYFDVRNEGNRDGTITMVKILQGPDENRTVAIQWGNSHELDMYTLDFQPDDMDNIQWKSLNLLLRRYPRPTQTPAFPTATMEYNPFAFVVIDYTAWNAKDGPIVNGYRMFEWSHENANTPMADIFPLSYDHASNQFSGEIVVNNTYIPSETMPDPIMSCVLVMIYVNRRDRGFKCLQV